MNQTIGKCGHCGGRVTVPNHYMSVKPPIPECERCGAQADDTAHLPVVPMKPKAPSILEAEKIMGGGRVPGAFHALKFR